MEWIFGLVGLGLGAIVTALILNAKHKEALSQKQLETQGQLNEQTRQLESAQQQLKTIQDNLTTTQQTLDKIKEEKSTLWGEKSKLEGKSDELDKQLTSLKEEEAELKRRIEKQQETIKTLTGETESLKTEVEKDNEWKKNIEEQWKQQLESFLLANIKTVKEDAEGEYQEKQKAVEEKIKGMLEPLSKAVLEYKKNVEDVDKDHHAGTKLIEQELKRLSEINTKLSSALTYNKGKGNWGELMLERLLEDSGLVEGKGYIKQETVGDGKRPDFRIVLPENRSLFIDSKALGIDLNEPEHDGTEEAFKLRTQRYLDALKAAVKGLSSKEYQATYQEAADFVILYVPHEGMLSLSYDADPAIFQWAYKQKVILASPLNMMAMLQLVHRTWKMYKLSQDASNILKLGETLHGQAVTVTNNLSGLGKTLGTLNKKYQAVWTSFTSERTGLKKRIEQLAEYGCDKGGALPEEVYIPEDLMVYETTDSEGNGNVLETVEALEHALEADDADALELEEVTS
ncbi:MAG: DNA recombination protein RmuC [Oligoflexales bacterium]